MAEDVFWLEATHYAASTACARRRNLRHFAAWCSDRGLMHACELTLPVRERYRHTLYHTRKFNGQPVGWGDQTHKLLAVKQFLRWATRMHVIWPRRGMTMRTNIDIDDGLMRAALRASHAPTKRAAAAAALRLLMQTRAQATMRRLRGKVRWEGDLSVSRRGRSRR